MDHVVGDAHPGQRRIEACGVEHVARRDFGRRGGARLERFRMTRQAAHGKAARLEAGQKPPADVSAGPGEEYHRGDSMASITSRVSQALPYLSIVYWSI
jgi:hypothetical protein